MTVGEAVELQRTIMQLLPGRAVWVQKSGSGERDYVVVVGDLSKQPVFAPSGRY